MDIETTFATMINEQETIQGKVIARTLATKGVEAAQADLDLVREAARRCLVAVEGCENFISEHGDEVDSYAVKVVQDAREIAEGELARRYQGPGADQLVYDADETETETETETATVTIETQNGTFDIDPTARCVRRYDVVGDDSPTSEDPVFAFSDTDFEADDIITIQDAVDLDITLVYLDLELTAAKLGEQGHAPDATAWELSSIVTD